MHRTRPQGQRPEAETGLVLPFNACAAPASSLPSALDAPWPRPGAVEGDGDVLCQGQRSQLTDLWEGRRHTHKRASGNTHARRLQQRWQRQVHNQCGSASAVATVVLAAAADGGCCADGAASLGVGRPGALTHTEVPGRPPQGPHLPQPRRVWWSYTGAPPGCIASTTNHPRSYDPWPPRCKPKSRLQPLAPPCRAPAYPAYPTTPTTYLSSTARSKPPTQLPVPGPALPHEHTC